MNRCKKFKFPSSTYPSSNSGYSSVIVNAKRFETQTKGDGDGNTDDIISKDEESEDETFAAMLWFRGKLGAAVYHVNSRILEILSEKEESGPDFTITRTFLTQAEPSNLVISKLRDFKWYKSFRPEAGKDGFFENSGNETESETSQSLFPENPLPHSQKDESQKTHKSETSFYSFFLVDTKFHTVTHNYFDYDNAKSRILMINLPNLPPNLDEQQKFIYLSTIINFEEKASVQAVGALLKYLDVLGICLQQGFQEDVESIKTSVSSIRYIKLQNYVYVDLNTIKALSIFRDDWHPSTFHQGRRMKEGLSVFALFDSCITPMGKKLMRKIFMRPLYNAVWIQESLSSIQYFVTEENFAVKQYLIRELRNIKNLMIVVKRMRVKELSLNDWNSLFTTVCSALNIVEFLKEHKCHELAVFRKIQEVFNDSLTSIAQLLHKVFNFERSNYEKRLIINEGFDQQLDELKDVYRQLDEVMHRTAQQDLQLLWGKIKECCMVYYPQLGYFLCLELSKYQMETEDYFVPGIEFSFNDGEKAYYKSPGSKHLDEKIGDIKCAIMERETFISRRVQAQLLKKIDVVFDVMECCAELDCLLTKVKTAVKFKLVCPTLNEDNVIDIRQGAHLTQQIITQPFIPNDFLSGVATSKVKIITGPNSCGKSVYLRQVGLIVYLVHIGCFVPANYANVCLVDKIFTRIHAEESVTTGMSSFLIDLSQVSSAIESYTDNSLILIDEFGKGTQASDGFALLVSTMNYFLANNTPHLLLATHFHGIVKHIIDPNSLVLYQTFEVIRSEKKLDYTFKLMNGSINDSLAFDVARVAGIDEETAQRAEKLQKVLANNKDLFQAAFLLDKKKARKKKNNKICDEFMKICDKSLSKSRLEKFVLFVSEC